MPSGLLEKIFDSAGLLFFRIKLKLPRYDNMIFVKDRNNEVRNIILQFKQDDDYGTIRHFYDEMCEGLNFTPDTENVEEKIRKFAKNRTCLLITGTYDF